ncbi:short-chain dehydrogenase reductase sdr [Fusarium beomiforme]|uniref:Short-chain dehydrogenase reductase sdr n=1 Tax=Fusarium beomiforme TaxID=44412 RepID=A0A9P5A7K9_9HYPO|nr:short-chain dehydrogenase reductase sdr [Fusarium beomiforme]
MSNFTTEAFTLLGIGLAIIGLRWYVRISAVGIRGLQPDDYLMALVVVSYTLETVLRYNVGARWHGLANNGMTNEQRASLDPGSDEYTWRINGSKTQLKGWAAYSFLLWCLKASMCTFYLRLTDGLRKSRVPIYVGFVLIITWITIICCVMFTCRPFHKNWQINPDPGNLCQPAVSRVNLFTMVALNGATDLYLLLIPIPMLLMAPIRLRKKLGLVLLFSGGIFTTTAGIVRCVLVLTNPIKGAQEAGNWACRESFVAIVTTNIPMIFPLIRRMLAPIISTFSPTTPKYGLSRLEENPQPESIRLDDNINRHISDGTIH